jgi:hypothetical protein
MNRHFFSRSRIGNDIGNGPQRPLRPKPLSGLAVWAAWVAFVDRSPFLNPIGERERFGTWAAPDATGTEVVSAAIHRITNPAGRKPDRHVRRCCEKTVRMPRPPSRPAGTPRKAPIQALRP